MLEKTRIGILMEKLIALKERDVVDMAIELSLDDIPEYIKNQLRNEEYEGLREYSEVSVELAGKPDGKIRLFDTGNYYNSIRSTIADNGNIEIDSQPFKREKNTVINIEKEFLEDDTEIILRLTDENMEKVIKTTKDGIIDEIRTILLLTDR